MRKIYILVVLFLLIVVSFGLAYKYAGLKEHFKYMSYLNALPDTDEKKREKDMFFGNTGSNLYGGTLAWITPRGLFVWGRMGLRYFTLNAKTSFLTIYNCFKDSGQEFETIYYRNFSDWRKFVEYGNHVFVDYSPASKSGTWRLFSSAKGVMANPDFDISTFYFCRTKIFD